MTARDQIDRRFRRVMQIFYLGFALFGGAIFANKALAMPGWVWVPGLLGFAVAWLTMAGAYIVGFHCPTCGGRMTALLMQRGGFRMDPSVHFCPYCGQDLDAELFADSARGNGTQLD